MTDKAVEIFNAQPPGHYDEKNRHFAPVSAHLHFLTRLVLQGLPPTARILSVGVGTGIELVELARANPGWTFDALDPAKTMIDDCRRRLAAEGLTDRCRLTHGYLRDFAGEGPYDAVLCFLVMHFIGDTAERLAMYTDMHRHLRPGGYLVTAEISYDQSSASYRSILDHWRSMHRLGGNRQSLDEMAATIRDHLGVVAPEVNERLIRDAGFTAPVQFLQSLLIRGWFAQTDVIDC